MRTKNSCDYNNCNICILIINITTELVNILKIKLTCSLISYVIFVVAIHFIPLWSCIFNIYYLNKENVKLHLNSLIKTYIFQNYFKIEFYNLNLNYYRCWN